MSRTYEYLDLIVLAFLTDNEKIWVLYNLRKIMLVEALPVILNPDFRSDVNESSWDNGENKIVDSLKS